MSVADVTSALTPQQFADFSTFIAQHLGISHWRAALHASRAMVEALAAFIVFSLIFA